MKKRNNSTNSNNFIKNHFKNMNRKARFSEKNQLYKGYLQVRWKHSLTKQNKDSDKCNSIKLL